MITLRDGGSFGVEALASKISELGGAMVLGAVKASLKEHTKPNSLDYWVRTNGAFHKDQMQAETRLIDQLIATGRFDRIHMSCPSTGQRCMGLRLANKSAATASQDRADDQIFAGEPEAAAWLKGHFISASANLAYANLDEVGKYKGWVSEFSIPLLNGSSVKLDLRQERDLFLLFVLAVVWSRTGPWENAVYFVAWMKLSHKDVPAQWVDELFVARERNDSEASMRSTLAQCLNPRYRKQVSFRADLYASVHQLAQHWDRIKDEITLMVETGRYVEFFNYMRSIKGLGVGQKSMLIKIPLILRELRCQLYPSIPGELCCVPDARVYEALSEMAHTYGQVIHVPRHWGNVNGLIRASSKIYQLFGDLYDLPLFAYPDIVFDTNETDEQVYAGSTGSI